MKDNISPEEKLLRLIKGQKKEELPLDKKNTILIPEAKPYLALPVNISIKKYFSFLYFRRIAFFIFAASCAYLIISLIYPWLALRKINLSIQPEEKPQDTKKWPGPETKTFEFYLEGIKNRRIFSSTASAKESKPPNILDTGLINDLNLIGIVSGDNPQAVIEDKKTQKTFYLNKGELIGEFLVEDILEGKIILNHNSQKYELHL